METWVVPVIVAVIMGLPGMYATIRGARKDKVDSAATISQSALEQLEFYRGEVAELRKQVEKLECDILKERDKRRELEEAVRLKDDRIVELEAEVLQLRSEVEALQRKRPR